jgi:hypothetical protein
MVQAGASLASNTNPLRQSEPHSDRISVVYAGLRVNQPFARQRLLLDVASTAYRYARLSYLDFDALDYRGEWLWQLGERLSGSLGTGRVQQLADYSEFRDVSQRNVLSMERTFAAADAWLFGGWHALGSIEEQKHKYSVPFPQRGSYHGNGGEAGVMYSAPGGSSTALRVRALDARYVDRSLDPAALLDDGFRRSEAEVALVWVATARTTIEVRGGWMEYRSNHFEARDFSGPVWFLAYRWEPLARIALSATSTRTLEAWADQYASYRAVDRDALEVRWSVAPRTAVRASLGRQHADYRQPVPGFSGLHRVDDLGIAQLGVDWNVRRNIAITATLQRERQKSSDPLAHFEARVAMIGVSVRF